MVSTQMPQQIVLDPPAEYFYLYEKTTRAGIGSIKPLVCLLPQTEFHAA